LGSQPTLQNIFLTDENVDDPAIELAIARDVQIIRDVDIDIPCEIHDYDQCLFDYAVEHNYVLVTNNTKDFEPKFWHYLASGQVHPGIIFIRNQHRSSSKIIAEWLKIYATEPCTNLARRIPE
jgi:hypothetical protein